MNLDTSTTGAGNKDGPTIESVLEAVLFLGGPPRAVAQLQELLRGVEVEQISEVVAHLNRLYHAQRRPYEIRHSEGGYQLVLRPEFESLAHRINNPIRTIRLSKAALETLSIVAYRQPVSVQEIDALRGADSGAIIRQLRRRNLVEPADRESSGRSAQYCTTRRFLELLHIKRLEDLPRLQDL